MCGNRGIVFNCNINFQGSEELFLVDPLAPPEAHEPTPAQSISAGDRIPFLAEAVRRADAAARRDLLDDTGDAESKCSKSHSCGGLWNIEIIAL